MSRPAQNLSSAFKLVRDLLAEQPRTFQELLRAGVAAVPSSTSTSASASSSTITGDAAAASTSSVNAKGKGKASAARKVQKAELSRTESIVPEGHPFVSANHLKHKILPILNSQNLITKKLVRDPSSSSSSSSSSKGQSFIWQLIDQPPQPSSSTSSASLPSAPTWDLPTHWSRLLASEPPSRLAAEYAQFKAARRAWSHEASFASGQKDRGERDIWAWEGRAKGSTTVLERDHLNTRRARARPGKERKRMGELGSESSMQRPGEEVQV